MNPALYRLKEKNRQRVKKEKGTIIKSFEGKVTVALIYPNLYSVGMSNLGFQKIYSLLNREEQIVCERVFLPEKEDIELLKKNRIPLMSVESQKQMREFDILAFSVTFELDYLNIVRILDLAHIPVLSRGRDDNHPLIAAGGICPTFNPEPVADFLDTIIIGEGEVIVPKFIAAYMESLDKQEDRKTFFKRISQIKGIYIPSAYKTDYEKDGRIKKIAPEQGYPPVIKKDFLNDLNDSPTSSQIVAPDTVFSDMFLVEVERGCAMGCKFCVGGHLYHPQRVYSLANIIEQIKIGKKLTKKIGLVGMAVSNYPQLEELCRYCCKEGVRISISSLRIDRLSDDLFELLYRSGQKTITFAPETGAERLRSSINKNISNDRIMKSIERALMHNIPNIKLYFLIGLPEENDNDINAIITLAKEIKGVMMTIGKKKGKIGTLILSITPFIPKPSTPYQFERMEGAGALSKKIKSIRSALKKEGNIKIIYDSPKWAIIQGILSTGDRRISELILKTHELDGDWYAGLRASGTDAEFYVHRKKGKDEILPWSHLAISY